MKRIIDFKRYDTDTAAFIAEWGNGCNGSDFNYCLETLYVTRRGVWFLHGQGGAHSKYAEPATGHNSFVSGETILPLSEEQAAAWIAEKRPRLFDKYFAHLATDA